MRWNIIRSNLLAYFADRDYWCNQQVVRCGVRPNKTAFRYFNLGWGDILSIADADSKVFDSGYSIDAMIDVLNSWYRSTEAGETTLDARIADFIKKNKLKPEEDLRPEYDLISLKVMKMRFGHKSFCGKLQG